MPSEKKLLKLLKEYTASIERRHRSRSRSRRRRKRTPSTSRSPRRPRGGHARSRSPVRRESEVVSPTDIEDGNDTNEENNTTQAAESAPTIEVEESHEVTNPYSEALGEDYIETTKFGENIHEDISRRWSHILVNGLTKDQRDSITKKHKIPNNCTLLEAPTINVEVKNVLAEASKLRDKSIEIGQAQLGLATAILGKAMTLLIENEDINKVNLVSMLSDAAKLFNDLHYHQTKTRKKLITPKNKNFNQTIENTKRNNFLFGDDLSETIKNSKQLQQCAAHIKKTVPANQNITMNKSSGNRNGPPPRPRGKGMTRGGPKRQDFQTSQPFQPYHNQQKRPSSYQHHRRQERSTQGSRSAGRKRY